MEILSEWYGDLVSQHHGEGTLNGLECEFEIGQMKCGTVVLYSTVDLRSATEADELEIELAGTTRDNVSIVAKGKVGTGSDPFSNGAFCFGRGPFEFTVGDINWNCVQEIRFSLTNFLFSFSVGRAGELVDNLVRLGVTLDGTDVTFEKTSQFDAVWKFLT